ncbi:MAG: hypothetical protein GXP14_05810 [Gammaproteobacteria bacterium]|nr:hypothetical protein [Gammaproteobacteria bacterium]
MRQHVQAMLLPKPPIKLKQCYFEVLTYKMGVVESLQQTQYHEYTQG